MRHTLRLIADLLTPKERVRAVGLGAGMIVAGLLELAGVGSVVPFMQVVSDPSVLEGSGLIARTYDRLGFASQEAAIAVAGGLLVFAITLNNSFNGLMVWLISGWGWQLNHRLTVDLLGQYVHRPYRFFLGTNTATLNQKLLSEVVTVVSGVVIPTAAVIARSVGVLMVVSLLAWASPLLALTLAISFGGGYGAVYGFLRRDQAKRGKERFELNGARYRIAGEVLSGIKAVKALGREDEYLRRFAAPSEGFSRIQAHHQVAALLPRYVLETLAAATIILLVLLTLRGTGDLAGGLPTLSLFAFGAYRLMPSLNAIFRSVVAVRFNLPALHTLHEEMMRRAPEPVAASVRAPAATVTEPDTGAPLIELRRLRYRYPDSDAFALDGIDLSVAPGEVVGFVGETGSGKTTLFDVLLGLLEPTDGQVLIDGRALGQGSAAWRSRCGYVPQDVFLADDTVSANIAFGVPANETDGDAVEMAARVAQIHDFIAGLPDGYETVVGERGVRMSGGQRQRLGVARALYGTPEVLFFDEATSALDGATESALLETLDSLTVDRTVLVIAHRLTTVRACDVIHVMDAGRIVASGTHDELMKDHAGFRAMAGELTS